MQPEIVPFEAEAFLDWGELTEALVAGHRLPKAEMSDTFLYRDPDTLLNRSAWIDGLGMAVKTATVFPGNPARDHAMVNGAVSLYDDGNGLLQALVDFHLVTKWKTAGDSLLAAKRLARPDSKTILLIGAGTVGHSLYQAYSSAFPGAQFLIWNRSPSGATRMAASFPDVSVVTDLQAAVAEADIICAATMSNTPILHGAWLRPGQHIDLIGAFRPDMREADDETLRRVRIFVDSFDTTLDHIGELKIPLEQGVIRREDVLADFYDLDSGAFSRQSDDEITLFKNGGGAHLDLMTSRYILQAWPKR